MASNWAVFNSFDGCAVFYPMDEYSCGVEVVEVDAGRLFVRNRRLSKTPHKWPIVFLVYKDQDVKIDDAPEKFHGKYVVNIEFAPKFNIERVK